MVGESGLFTPADIAYVQEAGVKAVSAICYIHHAARIIFLVILYSSKFNSLIHLFHLKVLKEIKEWIQIHGAPETPPKNPKQSSF